MQAWPGGRGACRGGEDRTEEGQRGGCVNVFPVPVLLLCCPCARWLAWSCEGTSAWFPPYFPLLFLVCFVSCLCSGPLPRSVCGCSCRPPFPRCVSLFPLLLRFGPQSQCFDSMLRVEPHTSRQQILVPLCCKTAQASKMLGEFSRTRQRHSPKHAHAPDVGVLGAGVGERFWGTCWPLVKPASRR